MESYSFIQLRWFCLFSLFVCWTAGNDGIGDEGAIGIAKGLETNTSLRVLNLGSVFPPLHTAIQACISSHSFLS
jgi:hypothetical protein